MRLNSDGVTPVPRMLPLSEFLLHGDFQVELDGPVFVAAGVVHSSGIAVLVNSATASEVVDKSGDPVSFRHQRPADALG